MFYFACMNVSLASAPVHGLHAGLPQRLEGGVSSFWMLSSGWFWAVMWVLESNPGPLLEQGISPTPQVGFNMVSVHSGKLIEGYPFYSQKEVNYQSVSYCWSWTDGVIHVDPKTELSFMLRRKLKPVCKMDSLQGRHSLKNTLFDIKRFI